MRFVKAVWYLVENGVSVQRTDVTSRGRRFYKVEDTGGMPPVLLLPHSICTLAAKIK